MCHQVVDRVRVGGAAALHLHSGCSPAIASQATFDRFPCSRGLEYAQSGEERDCITNQQVRLLIHSFLLTLQVVCNALENTTVGLTAVIQTYRNWTQIRKYSCVMSGGPIY